MSFIAIFLASLLGSLHCVGMCGGFVSICSSEKHNSPTSLGIYHLGRLIAYSLLGGLAGFLGNSLDRSGLLIGIQHVSTLLAGTFLIIMGMGTFFNSSSISVSTASINYTAFLKPLYSKILSGKISQQKKSMLLGILSGLLPCGWLYTYITLAASTASALIGSLVMLFFWLGTVPLLSLVGIISNVTLGKFKPYLPKTIGILLILAGIWSLGSHLGFLPMLGMNSNQHHHH